MVRCLFTGDIRKIFLFVHCVSYSDTQLLYVEQMSDCAVADSCYSFRLGTSTVIL